MRNNRKFLLLIYIKHAIAIYLLLLIFLLLYVIYNEVKLSKIEK